MKTKILIAVYAHLTLLHLAQSQCINRILPGCAPNILPIGETILPNQFYPPSFMGPNIIDYPYDILPNGQILPGQLLPSVFPGPNLLPGPLPNVFPGPILPSIYPQGPSILPGTAIASVPGAVLPTTTIIQDSTVANNLANALQLLVVSNLLANTLPQNDVYVPNYPQVDFLSPVSGGPCGYNYIY